MITSEYNDYDYFNINAIHYILSNHDYNHEYNVYHKYECDTSFLFTQLHI